MSLETFQFSSRSSHHPLVARRTWNFATTNFRFKSFYFWCVWALSKNESFCGFHFFGWKILYFWLVWIFPENIEFMKKVFGLFLSKIEIKIIIIVHFQITWSARKTSSGSHHRIETIIKRGKSFSIISAHSFSLLFVSNYDNFCNENVEKLL